MNVCMYTGNWNLSNWHLIAMLTAEMNPFIYGILLESVILSYADENMSLV